MAATILFLRVPGLLAIAARDSRKTPSTAPLAVTEGRAIRSACSLARQHGIAQGQGLSLARRRCPFLLTIPVEEVNARADSITLWNLLAALSSVVEPCGPDAAFADLAGTPVPDLSSLGARWTDAIMGIGSSRTAARALAEEGLPLERLADADSRWLWPEDSAIAARLFRLGLMTFGQVAAIGESALVYQFGKIGRLLHRRALGENLDPIRALWPPPTVEAKGDFTLEPIVSEQNLRTALSRLAATISRELGSLKRYARRLSLTIRTERGGNRREWVLPAPIQDEREVLASLRRLRQQVNITAPVTVLSAVALDLDLPAAVAGNLFDNRAAERKLALAATRQKLHARYGLKSLFPLSSLPVSQSDQRRELWKASRTG